MAKIWKRGLIGLAALAVILAAGCAWLVYQLGHAPLPPPLAQLSNLDVKREDGSKARLGSDLRAGVPTLVVMWASWCVPCRDEAPIIAELRHKNGPDKLNIVSLNIAVGAQTVRNVAEFREKGGTADIPYVAIGPEGYSRIAGTSMIAIPRDYLFDKAGRPVKVWTGMSADTKDELFQSVNALQSE